MITDSQQLIGQSLGKCTLQRLIGRGGMGAVYTAQQSQPRRTVAIKVLLPGALHDTPARNDFLARFRREANAIADLDHVNIMPIYEYGEEGSFAYLVMPHVTGGTLRQVLEARGRLPLSEAVPIIQQAADALDYAHARGIVHRDLKPGNILFHSDGRVVIADFGLAKVLHERAESGKEAFAEPTSSGVMIGTPEYLSPEQALGKPVDRRADIYSLGIVLFHMLTGRVPFSGLTPVATAIQHTTNEPPSISELNATIPPAVEAVVMKALAKNPRERFETAGDFARALEDAAKLTLSPSPNAPYKANGQQRTPMMLMSNDTIPDMPLLDEETTIKISPDMPQKTREQPSSPPPITAPRRQNGPATHARQGCLSLWMALLGVALAVCLVIGGSLAYFHVFGGNMGSATTFSGNTLPTAKPASTVEPTVPTALIPQAGKLLFAAPVPDSPCGSWDSTLNAHVICHSTDTEISDSSSKFTAGLFLDLLPNGDSTPNDRYVLQVQVREASGSHGAFGVFFRNQPSLAHNGAYSFLIKPDHSWIAYEYNDASGHSTELGKGAIVRQINSLMTIDVVVQGDTFTFYLNGDRQGQAISKSYPGGTNGLAVDVGADVFFSNFAIYALK